MTTTNQTLLFEPLLKPKLAKPVNVASVPHRSPFRYPGGKTWFVPTARKWEHSWPSKNMTLLEPFAGGAIVGLSAVFEGMCSRLIMAETDPMVNSVWKTILSRHSDWLCDQILNFEVTESNVRMVLGTNHKSTRQIAFQTIIRNRMQHGGILAPGASLIKNGESGKGLHSRWYPDTLVKRITAINGIKDKIVFSDSDGIELMRTHRLDCSVAAFVDPPYTASKKSAGNRLYAKHQLDHRSLFEVSSEFAGPLLMTYDDSEEVSCLADEFNLARSKILMRNRRHKEMFELILGNELSWLIDSKD